VKTVVSQACEEKTGLSCFSRCLHDTSVHTQLVDRFDI